MVKNKLYQKLLKLVWYTSRRSSKTICFKDNPPKFLTSAKDAFTPTTGTEGFGKFTSVFDNLASGAAQPSAYIPIGIGGSGLGMIQAQEQYEEDLAEGQQTRLITKRIRSYDET